jgi:hypothetical protein
MVQPQTVDNDTASNSARIARARGDTAAVTALVLDPSLATAVSRPAHAFAVTVGRKPSAAQFYADGPDAVLALVEALPAAAATA